MKAISKLHFSALALGIAFFLWPSRVEARPFLYMSSFDYTGSYLKCLTQAEKALRLNGFIENLKIDKSDQDKAGVVYANMSGESMMAEIQCVQKAGITILGVAGLDSESTWEAFQKLKKAEW